jgi:hypothetical protein
VPLAKELPKLVANTKDEQWQAVHDLIYERCLRRSKFRFVDRYLNNVLVTHFHCMIQVNRSIGSMDGFVKFCAVLEHGPRNTTGEALSGRNRVPSIYESDSGLKISVLVDVREDQKHPEKIMEPLHAMVRLQSLDQCERTAGNPVGKVEFVNWDWPESFITNRSFREQGELTLSQNFLRQWPYKVPPDEIEKHVIERRPELINNLARDYGDDGGRLLGDLQLCCAVRLNDLFVRTSASVFGDGILKHFLVIHSPDDLCSGRFNPARHESVIGA